MNSSFDTRLKRGLFPEMPQSFADGLLRAAETAGGTQNRSAQTDAAKSSATGSEPKKRRFPVGKVLAGALAAVLVAASIVIAVFAPGIGRNKHGAVSPAVNPLLGRWTLAEVEQNGETVDPETIGLQMDMNFSEDGSVTVTTVTGGAEGQYVYRYAFADNAVELTAESGEIPVLPASGVYDPETNTLRFANEDGDGAVIFSCVLNKQTLTGIWKQTRREHAVDPSEFVGINYEAWEYVEWEKNQTWEEDAESLPWYLEFTPDGRMYHFLYAPDGGVQGNQSASYTISGNTLTWSGFVLRYDAETDTICWIFPSQRREIYERASETEIVDPYRQKLSELRKQYPEYFGIDTFQKNLLKVYVWQINPASYSCALVSGREVRSEAEIGMMRGVTIEEMRMILSTYYEARDCNIEPENVEVVPFHNPVSSYWYEIDKAYTARVKWLLLGTPIEDGGDLLHAAPIDTAVYDVDSDGALETCVLSYGPTSGLFTVVFHVYRNGTLAYLNTFNMEYGELYFNRSNDGLILEHVVPGHDNVQFHASDYRISIENSAIVLTDTETDEAMEYWGAADTTWNMKVPTATPERRFGGAWYCYDKGAASDPGYDELLVIEFDPDGRHVSFTEDRKHYDGYTYRTDTDDPKVLILTNETTGDVRRATLDTAAKLRFETDRNARGERSEWTYYSLPVISAEDLPFGDPASLWFGTVMAAVSGTEPTWCNGPLGMFDLDGDGRLELIRLTWTETDRKMTVEAFTNHNRAAYTGYIAPFDFGTNEGELYYTVENVTNPENLILIDLDPNDGRVNLLVSADTENGGYIYELHVENGALVCGHVADGYCFLADSAEQELTLGVPTDLFGAKYGYREVRGEALEPVDDVLHAYGVIDTIAFGPGREKNIEDGTLLHLVRALPCEIDGVPGTLEPGVYMHLREWNESMTEIVFLTEDGRWITVRPDAGLLLDGVSLYDYFDNAPQG